MVDFSEVYAEYFSAVYKFSVSLCRDKILAEEITQETFFKALQSIDKFNGSCKLSVWLCQIAKNTYFSHHQKCKKRMLHREEPQRDNSFYPENDSIDKETTQRLHRRLHNLHEPYKEVFTLRVFGELSFADIGGLFEKSDSWARLVYYRAKKHLQEELK